MLHGERARFIHRGRGWVVRLDRKPGAGYIGGWTAFIAWRSGSLRWKRAHRAGSWRDLPAQFGAIIGWLEVGVTKNGNVVPYAGE